MVAEKVFAEFSYSLYTTFSVCQVLFHVLNEMYTVCIRDIGKPRFFAEKFAFNFLGFFY